MESNNSATLSNAFVLDELKQKFGSSILASDEQYGMLSITLDSNQLLPVLSFLKEHEHVNVNFLTDICGSHYPDLAGRELCVVYHVHSLTRNFRMRIKCFIPIANPLISSATSLFASANWMERETYDFYGIQFESHPNLKRILNVDEMDYFPLRKEYPLEDGTRTDKEDHYFGR